MKNEKIELPMNLAIAVNQELKQKYGIEKNREDFRISGIHFTEEELSKIKSLKFINPTRFANPKESFFKGIHLLPNLESIEVESEGIDLKHEKGILSITDQDMDEISGCTKLKRLSIINQPQLNWIDISGLSNLEELTIVNNPNLTQVDGMDNVNINSETTINMHQMIQLHNKACQILDENIPASATKKDIIIGIENYLAKNVKYDWDAYNHGHTRGTTMNFGLRMQSGPKEGANGAYNTLLEKEGVCEGYTKAMQYLLRLKNIHSHNVPCAGEKDTTHMVDEYKGKKLPKLSHSIICIDDYYNLYDDPCWNACCYRQGDTSMPWILRTQGEISEDHTLFFDEKNVDNNNEKQPRETITASLMRNEVFRKTRVSAINNTRNSVARYIKGQVIIER